MSSYFTQYRNTHPEFREISNAKNLIKQNERYANNEEYREKKKQYAREYHQRRKIAKQLLVV